MKRWWSLALLVVFLGSPVSALAAAQPFGGVGDADESDAALAANAGEYAVTAEMGTQESASYTVKLWKNYTTNKVRSQSKIAVTAGNWDFLKVGSKLCRDGSCTGWYFWQQYNCSTYIWAGWSWLDAGTKWGAFGWYYFREGSWTQTKTLSVGKYL